MAGKVIVGFAFGVLAFAQQVRFDSVDPSVLEARLGRVSADNRTPVRSCPRCSPEAGCPSDQIDEPKVSGSKLPNVLCKSPGESGEAIVVGEHYE